MRIDKILCADIEADNLYLKATTVHCVHAIDVESGEHHRYDNKGNNLKALAPGVKLLGDAKEVWMHNGIDFDIFTLRKFFPNIDLNCRVMDTLVISRLLWPNSKGRGSLLAIDIAAHKKGKNKGMPAQLFGNHSLEAWGYRLGVLKGDYGKNNDWSKWSQEMSDYCDQDNVVLVALRAYLLKCIEKIEAKSEGKSIWPAIKLEHQVRHIVSRQSYYGFKVDRQAITDLEETLKKGIEDVEADLRKELGDTVTLVDQTWIPKRDDKKRGRKKGVPVVPVEPAKFGSAKHLEILLKEKYGWTPTQRTSDGKMCTKREYLETINLPVMPLLLERDILVKRVGLVSQGDESWLNNVDRDTWRMHGSVNTNGAVTGRMTHSKPNMAQVPKVVSGKDGPLMGRAGDYGYECRACFVVPKGKVLVGADASGLELRCLSHYMGFYDDGAYAKELLEGDIHSANQRAAGLPDRDTSKTFIYAFLYGAGNEKIGSIVGKGAKEGHRLKEAFKRQVPALGKLARKVDSTVSGGGTLRGLDGRVLPIRSKHAALNTLLQSAGAVVMKQALVFLDETLQETLRPGIDYEFVNNVHDEWQIETYPQHAEFIAKTAVDSIRRAGEHFNFRCPLDGEAKIGKNWAETH